MLVLNDEKFSSLMQTIQRYYKSGIDFVPTDNATAITQGIHPFGVVCSLFTCTHRAAGKQFIIIITDDLKLEKALLEKHTQASSSEEDYLVQYFKTGSAKHDFKHEEVANELEQVGAIDERTAEQLRKIGRSAGHTSIIINKAYYVKQQEQQNDKSVHRFTEQDETSTDIKDVSDVHKTEHTSKTGTKRNST